MKRYIQILEIYPTLRINDYYGDYEIDFSEEEIKYYEEIMDKYGDLQNFLKEKIKESGENPADSGIF